MKSLVDHLQLEASRKDEVQAENSRLRNEITQLQGIVKDFEAMNTENEARRRSANQLGMELGSENAALAQEVTGLKRELEDKETKLADHKVALRVADGVVVKLKAKEKELTQIVEVNEKRNTKQLAVLEVQTDVSNSELSAVKRENGKLRGHVAELVGELEAVKYEAAGIKEDFGRRVQKLEDELVESRLLREKEEEVWGEEKKEGGRREDELKLKIQADKQAFKSEMEELAAKVDGEKKSVKQAFEAEMEELALKFDDEKKIILTDKKKELADMLVKVEALHNSHQTMMDTRTLKIKQLELEVEKLTNACLVLQKDNKVLTAEKQEQINELVGQVGRFEEMLMGGAKLDMAEGEREELEDLREKVRRDGGEDRIDGAKRSKPSLLFSYFSLLRSLFRSSRTLHVSQVKELETIRALHQETVGGMAKKKDAIINKLRGKVSELGEALANSHSQNVMQEEEMKILVKEQEEEKVEVEINDGVAMMQLKEAESRLHEALEMVDGREKVIEELVEKLGNKEREVEALGKHMEIMDKKMRILREKGEASRKGGDATREREVEEIKRLREEARGLRAKCEVYERNIEVRVSAEKEGWIKERGVKVREKRR